MNEIVKFFEGHEIRANLVNQRPAWAARDIGAALGYANEGKDFAAMIRGEWSERLREGKDFVVLVDDEANAFVSGSDYHSSANVKRETNLRRSVIVLFESGVYATTILSNKPEADRLRWWLADEVLPSIVRTGAYGSAPAPIDSWRPRYEAASRIEDPRMRISAQHLAFEIDKIETDAAEKRRQMELRAAHARNRDQVVVERAKIAVNRERYKALVRLGPDEFKRQTEGWPSEFEEEERRAASRRRFDAQDEANVIEMKKR